MNFQNLHESAVEIAQRFHKAEIELIEILQKIEELKVFVRLGYSSLFDYATKALKLSEANASNFITVARKSKQVPELKQAIQNGELTVSKARKITPVINSQNKDHWLSLASELPKHKLEKEIAKIIPQALTPERTKYVTENRLELKLGVSEELMKKFRRAQDLVSQNSKKPVNLEETLDEILKIYLQSKDPVKKAERVKSTNADAQTQTTKKIDTAASVPGHIPFVRSAIPQSIKHQVFFRDRGKCTAKTFDNKICGNPRWIQIHHVIPVSQGGTNDIRNLTTLCYNHHRQMHL